jgi:hypothetical protein
MPATISPWVLAAAVLVGDSAREINMRPDGAIVCDRYNDAIPIKATTAHH